MAYIPPSVKVMAQYFEGPQLLKDALRCCFFFLISAGVFVLSLLMIGKLTILPILMAIVVLSLFREFDIFGKLLFAKGVVKENQSEDRCALFLYLLSLKFLKERGVVYQKMLSMDLSENELLLFLGAVISKRIAIRPYEALTAARIHKKLGDSIQAVEFYQVADTKLEDDNIRMELGEVLLELSRAEECLQTLDKVEVRVVHRNYHYYYLRACALKLIGKYEVALQSINHAIEIRNCASEYYLEKGLILDKMGLPLAAMTTYNKALYMHKRNPLVYYQKGLLCMRLDMIKASIRNLRRSLNYDNSNTQAYILLCALRIYRRTGVLKVQEKSCEVNLTVKQDIIHLTKGQRITLSVEILSSLPVDKCFVTGLEPYGGGLEIVRNKYFIPSINVGQAYRVIFEVIAKRSDEVNLGNPWLLNIVLISDDLWTDTQVKFCVHDQEEGRVFFVVTNDHECRMSRERLLTRDSMTIDSQEARNDLIGKASLAQDIAEKYGVKWTHMIDAGTGWGLIKWAGERSASWQKLHQDLKAHYQQAYAKGHDCQAHIHLSGVPESYFFCYKFEPNGEQLVFDLEKKNKFFPGWQTNSWANVVPSFGTPSDTDSRLGSLRNATRELEMIFQPEFTSHKMVMFRAGQWDFGDNLVERERSVLALRKAGIMVDTSVTDMDNKSGKRFSFGKAPTKTVYFSNRNDIGVRAKRLPDCGILEVVPVSLSQGNHPLTPRSRPKAALRAYKSKLTRGKVKPGRHIIMEIEHIVTIGEDNGRKQSDEFLSREWATMDKHFATLQRGCRKLCCVGASEAIDAYLDYYTAEPIIKLANPVLSMDESGSMQGVVFDLKVIGNELICDKKRRYDVTISIPCCYLDKIRKLSILENKQPQYQRIYREGAMVGNTIEKALYLDSSNQNSFKLAISFT